MVFLVCGCLQSGEKTQTTTTITPVDPVTSTVWQEPTTTTMKTFCLDSDGFNIFSKGKTGGFYNGIEYEKSDECLNEGQVGEWVCDNKTGYAAMEPTDCPEKYVCSDGWCVRIETALSPTTSLSKSSSVIKALFTENELPPGTVLYATEAGGRIAYSVKDAGQKTNQEH